VQPGGTRTLAPVAVTGLSPGRRRARFREKTLSRGALEGCPKKNRYAAIQCSALVPGRKARSRKPGGTPRRRFSAGVLETRRWRPVYFAHGYSVLRTGLRGRALTGGPQWPAALRAEQCNTARLARITPTTQAKPRQGRMAAAPNGAPPRRPEAKPRNSRERYKRERNKSPLTPQQPCSCSSTRQHSRYRPGRSEA